MSSPTSRLRKTKRSPLPEARRVPFRQADIPSHQDVQCDTDSQFDVLEGIRSSHSPSQGRPAAGHFHRGESEIPLLRRRRKGRREGVDNVRALSSSTSNDTDLLGSMAARLAVAERELRSAKKEIMEKDCKIQELEKRLSLLVAPPLPPSTHQLEMKCSALQKQVKEMEEFLSDYGMVWVGTDGDQRTEVNDHNEEVWLPESSVSNAHKSMTVDFDLLVKNVKSLNVLAGEGSTSITSTPKGAKLKCVDAVPLTLYANGIVMFQGPFRPFTDPSTQQCIQDIQDGYFPSELQPQYPDGVPFQLSDKREVTFVPRGSSQIFPGSGQKLGGQKGPSKLINFPTSSSLTTSELPGPRLSADQFLSRLPAHVVRAGHMLSVRSEISDLLQGSPVSTVPSLATQEDDNRPRVCDPGPPSSLTTLRIRSESGDRTHVLHMRSHDTIADVWTHLLRQTNTHSGRSVLTPPHLTRSGHSYQLVSGGTHQVHSDPAATLQECGLTPNATLHITKISIPTPITQPVIH